MPIIVTCPSCRATFRAQDSSAGKRAVCRKCGEMLAVPAASTALIASPVKIRRCTGCQRDIGSEKRVKDEYGNYYCHPCWAARAAAAVSTNEVESAIAESHNPIDANESAQYAISEPTSAYSPSSSKSAPARYTCFVCRRLFSEDAVYEQSGSTICKGCYEARAAAVPPQIVHRFPCQTCGGRFTVDLLYDQNGSYICHSCYSRASAGPIGDEGAPAIAGTHTSRKTDRKKQRPIWVPVAIAIGIVAMVGFGVILSQSGQKKLGTDQKPVIANHAESPKQRIDVESPQQQEARKKKNEAALRVFLLSCRDFIHACDEYNAANQDYLGGVDLLRKGQIKEAMNVQDKLRDAGERLFEPATNVEAAYRQLPGDLTGILDASRTVGDVILAASHDVLSCKSMYFDTWQGVNQQHLNAITGRRVYQIDDAKVNADYSRMLKSLIQATIAVSGAAKSFGPPGWDNDPTSTTPAVNLTKGPRDAETLLQQGLALLTPSATQQDFQEAATRFRKAADLGNPEAMRQMGHLYVKGQGVPEDHAEAARWFEMAAKRGNAPAMTVLGVALEEGDGVAKDKAQAIQWYRKAAEANDPDGMCFLGMMYLEGEAVPKDSAEAYRWYMKAAERKHPMAMYLVGTLYEEGNGVDKDATQAKNWYQQAADAGFVDAMFRLGNLYFSGRGVAKDFPSAIKWYEKAANQGHGEAAFNLGAMYAKGIGIQHDSEQARKWLELAKTRGFERASAAIESLERQQLAPALNDLLIWAQANAEYFAHAEEAKACQRDVDRYTSLNRINAALAAHKKAEAAINAMQAAGRQCDLYSKKLQNYNEADLQRARAILLKNEELSANVRTYLERLGK